MRRPALLLALACAGCPGLGQVGFDVNSQGTSQIPGSPLGAPLSSLPGGFGSMSFKQSSDFQNNNTNKDHIDSCRVSKLTLTVVSPQGQTLSFLSSVEFYIKTDALPEVLIAQAASIPPGVSRIELTIPDQEIAAYAKSDSFSVTTKAAGSSPSQTTTLEADLTLHIVANVF